MSRPQGDDSLPELERETAPSALEVPGKLVNQFGEAGAIVQVGKDFHARKGFIA